MAKKRITPATGDADETPAADPASLGAYLAAIRGVRRLTLREVQDATGGVVSNAYLSQIENGRIGRPSPNVLHALAKALVVPYETLMEKAGHQPPVTAELEILRGAAPAKAGERSVFASELLTQDEEESLLEYLAFLRSRKGNAPKS